MDDGTSRGEEKKKKKFSPTQNWNTKDLLIQPPHFYTMEENGDQKGNFIGDISLIEIFSATPHTCSVLILSYTIGMKCVEINWIVVDDGLWCHNYLNLSIHFKSWKFFDFAEPCSPHL